MKATAKSRQPSDNGHMRAVQVDSLKLDGRNARKHGEKNLAAIKASLERFGQQKPIVVDGDGVVIAGNGTLEAARALGWKTIDVVRTKLKGAEARAFAIADNRTAELAEWDDVNLAALLGEIRADDDELARACGFDDRELGRITRQPPAISEPDDSIAVEPVNCRPGDIFDIGKHVIGCGSSLDGRFAIAVAGGTIPACVTDPPFDMPAADQVRAALAAFSDTVVVMGSGAEYFKLANDPRLQYRFDAVVDYGQPRNYPQPSVPAFAHNRIAAFDHVDVMVAGKAGRFDRHKFAILAGTHTTVIRAKARRGGPHPDAKPVQVFAPFVYAMNSDVIWEPFAGSGAVFMACDQIGVACRGIEIDPEHCGRLVAALQRITGQEARRRERTEAAQSNGVSGNGGRFRRQVSSHAR